MDDLVALQGHGLAVMLIPDQLSRVYAELGGQHPVIGARAAAALDKVNFQRARNSIVYPATPGIEQTLF